MPFIPIIIIQVLCGIHIVRTYQERYWLYIIIFLPGVGCAIYALSVMLPSLLGSHQGRRAVRQVHDSLDPQRHLRKLKDEVIIAETSQNYVLLADELARIGQLDEAIYHYQKALTGIFIHDTGIMSKLAQAQFDAKDFSGCKKTLDSLIEFNPQYQSQNGHLLYARTLQEIGDTDGAESEYKALIEYYNGPEARFHYFQFLKDKGDLIGAKEQLEIISTTARRAKPHYRKLHKELLAKVKKESKLLTQ